MKTAIVPIILVIVVAAGMWFLLEAEKKKTADLEKRVADLEQRLKESQSNILAELSALKLPDKIELPADLAKQWEDKLSSMKDLIDNNQLLVSKQFDSLKAEFSNLTDGLQKSIAESLDKQLASSLDQLQKSLMDSIMKQVQDLIAKQLGGGKSSTPALPIR
ncbi:MAG: hypothetical protein Kow00107_08530 [Planctomycetota bacterium]